MMHESTGKEERSPKKSASHNSSGPWYTDLKQFDIYQKIDDSYKIQTQSGATISILGWILIVFLTFFEIRNYVTPKFQERMAVDTILGEQLTINVNLTFHALNCNEAHLDVMDVAGDNQLNVEHEMIKQRIDRNGRHVGKAGVEIIGEGKIEVPEIPKDYCGSCYGAESPDRKCCNTCDDLIRAYQQHQWSTNGILRNSTQCIHDRAKHFSELGPNEGCIISGSMKVNKVAGNFHIAHGESFVRDSKHIHHFNPESAPSYNCSHTINSLSFGDAYENMPANALDSVRKIISEENGTGLFQYFIKIIPTVYTDIFGSRLITNQYTYSDRFRPFVMPKFDGTDKPGDTVLPGIFFVFEISPFMIEAQKSTFPFSHFLTKICAIVGGTFTMIGVIDGLIYRLSKLATGKR
jgi:hypothetical protein